MPIGLDKSGMEVEEDNLAPIVTGYLRMFHSYRKWLGGCTIIIS